MNFKKINGLEIIEAGENTFSVAFLKSVSEGQAIRSCSDKNSVIRAWKIANGKSVTNYLNEDDKEVKPKRTRKKKGDSKETKAQD